MIKTGKHWVLIIALYAVMLVWWVSIFSRNLIDTRENYFFGLAIGVLAVIGSVVGLLKSNQWGFLKSALGKSIFFLSIGVLTWGIGTIIFAYYNFYLSVAVPYPSMADVAYIFSWPLWTIGMVYLSRAMGIQYRLKKIGGKLFLFIIPLIIILASYYLLVTVARDGVIDFSGGGLKLFFDLAYPIGDVVILTGAVLIYGLSLNHLGGVFKYPILLIIFGFVLNYFSDFSFSYTTTNGSFYVASWVDLLFNTTFFVLSLGLSLFSINLLKNTDSEETASLKQ